ncbi:uncharacterized protein LOC128197726 isoform X1 [Vigna angularis]|uniref:uncharacterized protein LOC128197726 isoform X1 n=1 Tax=Phaseolus angularis TaxID=3914 RepID=UPI0022B2DD68|nr:uncharacterized protein LOC128197726 isoform X1 [Vigna angularis]
MNENDFCLGLGLSSDGENINLKDEIGNSTCVKYICKGTKDLNLIYKFLMRKHNKKIPSSPFCSLYILAGICEILFPKRSGRVFPIIFKIVDNLSSLGNYCWGSLVYRYLLRSLCKASNALKKGKGTRNIYVDGCIYMFQINIFFRYGFVSISFPPEGPIEKFPRILHWMNKNVGDNFIKQVHDDVYVGASSNDKKDEKHYRPTPKKKDDQPTPIKIQKRKCRESFMRALEDQKYLIKELKRRVVVLEAQLAEEKARRRNKDDGGQSMPRAEPSMNSGFVFPSGMYTNESPMKTYVRVGSQRRYKGRVLRTLYTRNGVLRIKNE